MGGIQAEQQLAPREQTRSTIFACHNDPLLCRVDYDGLLIRWRKHQQQYYD